MNISVVSRLRILFNFILKDTKISESGFGYQWIVEISLY